MKTFWSSDEAIEYLAERYGAADYNNWEAVPQKYWSRVPYGTAGAASYVFFADQLGTNSTNRQLTNMPKAGSFGQQHFLIKRITCDFFAPDPEVDSWDGTDAETLYSDMVNGLFQAGYFHLDVQAKTFVSFVKPFLTAGGNYGPSCLHYAGINALTLSEGTPNTILTYRTHAPFASLNHKRDQRYRVDPNLLIEAEQNFTVNIDYPSGALAPVATGIIDGSTAFYIGVTLHGLVLRPVQ